jgi:hypothetical protein
VEFMTTRGVTVTRRGVITKRGIKNNSQPQLRIPLPLQGQTTSGRSKAVPGAQKTMTDRTTLLGHIDART